MAKKDNQNKAEKFVNYLLTEGANVNCDETEKSFNAQEETIPPFYDEDLFRRGQEFYHRHIFALFMSKFYGLIAVLAIQSILKILIYTKMSGSDMTAYRRYLATIFHMNTWYDYEMRPGSKLWQSIAEVRGRHNSASKKSCAAGLKGINQKDMALTQFGFMGFALTRSKMVGIHEASEEEWKSFIHVWRVIGYLLGIEDRFNICKESVQETREICNLLLERVYRVEVEKKDKDFLEMTSFMINGLWCMSPILEYKVAMTYFYDIIRNNINKDPTIPSYMELSYPQRFWYNFLGLTVYSLRWNVFRVYHNYSQYLTLWLMKVFPFLAYYRFGIDNAHVKILSSIKDK